MDRRTFFKTLAATAVAAVVAPAVVGGVPFKPNRAQAVILDEFATKTDVELAVEIWDATLKNLPPQQDPFRLMYLAKYPYEIQNSKIS